LVAIFLLGFVLDYIRFDANNPVQPHSTVLTLGLILGGGALVGFVFALLSYAPYDLNREKIDRIQEQIRKRGNGQ
jgi:glycoside/pentoside/hexuronide:cation symporter, GPH family